MPSTRRVQLPLTVTPRLRAVSCTACGGGFAGSQTSGSTPNDPAACDETGSPGVPERRLCICQVARSLMWPPAPNSLFCHGDGLAQKCVAHRGPAR